MTNLTPDELGALQDLARDEAESGHPFACQHKAQKAFGGALRGGWTCLDCHVVVERWDHR